MSALAQPSAGIRVRDATEADIAAIRAIYAHHVLHGLSSFEETPPDESEMRRRLADIRGRGLPFVVAERHGRIHGYAYAGPYRTRSAYRYTVEDSVYVAPDSVGQGFGRATLASIIERCAACGLRQMIAVIGDSANVPSIRMHETLGFRPVAVLGSVGFKFGRWVDSVLMQRSLGPGDTGPPDR